MLLRICVLYIINVALRWTQLRVACAYTAMYPVFRWMGQETGGYRLKGACRRSIYNAGVGIPLLDEQTIDA